MSQADREQSFGLDLSDPDRPARDGTALARLALGVLFILLAVPLVEICVWNFEFPLARVLLGVMVVTFAACVKQASSFFVPKREDGRFWRGIAFASLWPIVAISSPAWEASLWE